MMRELKIKEKYANNESLKDLLTNIETRFEREGEIIYSNKRNTLKSFFIDGIGKIVIKKFRARNIFQAIYYTLSGTSKAGKAYHNAIALEEANVNTPEAIAYAEIKGALLLSHCYVATTFTADKDISELIDKETDHQLVKALGRILAQMHEHGIVHHDMNRTNILYHRTTNGYELSLIDINRMKISKKADFTEYSDDFVRLTDRMDWVLEIAYEYAKQRKMNADSFAMHIAHAKYMHNQRLERKKSLKRLFA